MAYFDPKTIAYFTTGDRRVDGPSKLCECGYLKTEWTIPPVWCRRCRTFTHQVYNRRPCVNTSIGSQSTSAL